MTTRDVDLGLIKTAYDLPTLFRVLPWIFLMRDNRDPTALVAAALKETRSFLEAAEQDPTRDRRALMRGLATTLFRGLGGEVNPASLEAIIGLVAQAVDGIVDEQFKPDLEGEVG